MATALAPRKPQDRGDVASRTPLRIRENVAAVRWFFHCKPWILWLLAGATIALVLEHHDVTLPAIGHFFLATGHVIAVVAEWAISLLPGHAK